MANGVYTAGIRYLIDNGWDTSDARVLLLDDAGTYTFDKDHDFLTDLTLGSNELSTTNYVRKALASEAESTNDTADEVRLDATDVTWTALGPASAGPTIQAAIVYFFVSADADSVPFLYLDDGMPRAVNGGDVTIQWNSEGLVNIYQAP